MDLLAYEAWRSMAAITVVLVPPFMVCFTEVSFAHLLMKPNIYKTLTRFGGGFAVSYFTLIPFLLFFDQIPDLQVNSYTVTKLGGKDIQIKTFSIALSAFIAEVFSWRSLHLQLFAILALFWFCETAFVSLLCTKHRLDRHHPRNCTNGKISSMEILFFPQQIPSCRFKVALTLAPFGADNLLLIVPVSHVERIDPRECVIAIDLSTKGDEFATIHEIRPYPIKFWKEFKNLVRMMLCCITLK